MSRRRTLILTSALTAAFAIFSAPAGWADINPITFDLNVDLCSTACLAPGTTGGTVTLTEGTSNGVNTVTVDVALSSGLDFHQTNGLDAFLFNVTGFSSLSLDSITSGYSINGQSAPGTINPADSGNEDGGGHFGYIVQYSCEPCTDGNLLSFTLDGTNLLNTNFESKTTTNAGGTTIATSNYDFAANVSVTGNGRTCTGLIAGGNGTGVTSPSGPGGAGCTSSTVPEPTAIAFFGTGLLGLGCVIRKKLASRRRA